MLAAVAGRATTPWLQDGSLDAHRYRAFGSVNKGPADCSGWSVDSVVMPYQMTDIKCVKAERGIFQIIHGGFSLSEYAAAATITAQLIW